MSDDEFEAMIETMLIIVCCILAFAYLWQSYVV